MKTTIYFIRHAEPNYENHDDEKRELSKKGLQDSIELVNFFKEIHIDAFYSSPYKRTIQTVAHLANARNLPIQLDKNLRERKISNHWIDDFDAFARKQWRDFSYHLADGESLAQVQERNIQALHRILKHHAKQTIIVGTHGTALSTILNYYQPSFSLEEFEKIKSVFPYIVKLTFSNSTYEGMEEIPFINKKS